MKRSSKPISLEKLKTYPLNERNSKVSLDDFATTWKKGGTFRKFIDGLPNILAVEDLKAVIQALVAAWAPP